MRRNPSGPGNIRLLPAELLIKTNDLDQAGWNYRKGPLGHISRRRYALVAGLLGRGYASLLEVGYGSGIFMPTLAARTDDLFGVDVHRHDSAVTQCLLQFGVSADLVSASVAQMPFADDQFDALVAVSCLEFVDDIDAACQEMARVLAPGGTAVFVTPGASPLLDTGLRLLTGQRAEQTFQGRRQRVLPALDRWFRVEQRNTFPAIAPHLYTVVRATKIEN